MKSNTNRAPLAALDPLARYSIAETLRRLGISKPTLYADIKAGRIRTIKHGRRRFCPGSEIARLSA